MSQLQSPPFSIARSLLLAVQFFTRLPLPASWARWADYSPARMRAAMAHMPAMGWLVGGCAAATHLVVVAMLVQLTQMALQALQRYPLHIGAQRGGDAAGQGLPLRPLRQHAPRPMRGHAAAGWPQAGA